MKTRWPALLGTLTLCLGLLAAPAGAAGQDEGSLIIGEMDETVNPLQTNIYKIHAGEGPLHLKAQAAPGALFHLQVEAWQSPVPGAPGNQVLFSGVLHEGWPEATVMLPADGPYRLILTRVMADGATGHGQALELRGQGLSASNLYVPPVQLHEMKPGQVMTEPFAAEAAVLPGAQARYLMLLLDDQILSTNLLQPDGSAAPYIVDPTQLTEGLHALSAVAQGPDPDHMAVAPRLFMVDQVDSFTDVPRSHWGRTAIEVLADAGILTGRGGGAFDPEAFVTREEFAKMLALVLGVTVPEAGGSRFADIPADWWSRPYVEALAAEGLIRGESIDGVDYFAPRRNISRAEAATILGRALEISELPVTDAPAFTDFDQVPEWARTSVTFLSQMKWIAGFPDGTFGPTQPLTRAQAARILAKTAGL